MERLTERDKNNVAYWCGINGRSSSDIKGNIYGEAITKLAEYEDAKEQGLLLRLPCKVGDVVYFPKYDYHDSAIITQIEIDKDGISFYWAQYEIGVDVTELWDDGYFSIDDIGKTVFLTKEEAEQALK